VNPLIFRPFSLSKAAILLYVCAQSSILRAADV